MEVLRFSVGGLVDCGLGGSAVLSGLLVPCCGLLFPAVHIAPSSRTAEVAQRFGLLLRNM